MLREWGPRPHRCSYDVFVFDPELKRCAIAVDVALPARMVPGPAKLLVPWNYHHGLFTVSELRRIDPGGRELQFTEGRRLFSCFFDFGLQPAMLATAIEGPPRLETLLVVVNLESPEPFAFAAGAETGAPSAAKSAGEAPARLPTSPARRALDTNASTYTPAATPSRQPIVMVPQAPWVLYRELAVPPASLVASLLNSSRSSAAPTGPLPRTSTANGASGKILAAQQRARERANRQRPRRQAPRRQTGLNDQPSDLY